MTDAGPLWGTQTGLAIDNFPVSGERLYPVFVQALAALKAAAAEANAGLGLLAPETAAVIVAAADDLARGAHADQFPVDVFQTGSGTSTNMNVNEVIATLAGRAGQNVHANDQVNASQSSNDVIPSAAHVAAAVMLGEQLVPALAHLDAVMGQRADALDHIVKTGRTHLMDAMPITFGQELSGWRAQLAGVREALAEQRKRLHALAIGGTAVGTGLNAPVGFAEAVCTHLSRRYNIDFTPADNRFAALAGMDALAGLSGQLKNLACVLMKIANDLRWMNSGPLSGLGEIRLPALQAGSSIMPGKVNPVIPEAVCMVCARVIGNDSCVTVAAQSGNFQLNVMWPVAIQAVLNSLQILANASRLLADKAIAGFSVDSERVAQALHRNPILVTALNATIGYEAGARIAKRAYAEGRPVLEVAVEETDLSREALTELLDPQRLAKP
jgi:fumarate hydratase, class II